MPPATIWEKVDALLARFDGHLRLDVATDCCWGGELRLGLTNPDDAPARSIVFYSVAGRDPGDVAKRLLADAEGCLATSGVNPLANAADEQYEARFPDAAASDQHADQI